MMFMVKEFHSPLGDNFLALAITHFVYPSIMVVVRANPNSVIESFIYG